MWSRYNGVLHRSAQNYWPLSRFFLSPHSSATTSTTHQQSVRPGFPGRVGNCESYCCPAAALFHRSHSSPFRVICSRRCSHASIKITNGHLRRWDGDILNNWRASKHISLCNNFLLISNFPAYHTPFIIPHFICILQFGYWKKKNPSELEVILNSPHKLDCFFFPLPAYFHSSRFVSAGDGCCFSPVVSTYCNSSWSYREAVMLCCARSVLLSDAQHLCAVRSLLMLVLWKHSRQTLRCTGR